MEITFAAPLPRPARVGERRLRVRQARGVRRRRRGRGDAAAAASARAAARRRARRRRRRVSLDGEALVAEARPAARRRRRARCRSRRGRRGVARAARPRLEPRLPRVLRVRRRGTTGSSSASARSPAASRCTPRRSCSPSAPGDRLGGDRLPGRVRGRRGGPRRHRPRPHDGARRPRAGGGRAVRRQRRGRSARTAASSSPGRRCSRRTASCSPSPARSGSPRSVGRDCLAGRSLDERGVSASSRPPSSSYAGKKSTTTRFSMPGAGADLELLAQLPHAPLADDLDRRRVRERERLDDLAADEVGVAVARQLEDAASRGEHPRVAVAHDEARLGRRVVVLEQLVEEPERAAPALDGLRRESVVAVEVDRALLAVRADEERHAGAG